MFRHKGHTSVEGSDVDEKHRKEHIICAADDHKMNRHHFSLFIRNCRLILLVRRHFRPSSLNNIFSPAEWRWKIPEVCDNEWHRYVINWKAQDGNEEDNDGQDVILYIDGRPTSVEPEVIDDWPLHPSHGLEMTMTLAACWQGRENRLRHQFSGDISEIKIKIGSTLPPESQLINGEGVTGKCAERIRYIETTPTGQVVSSNEGHKNGKTNNTTTSSEWTIVKSDHGLDIMKSRNDDVILVREQIVLKTPGEEELSEAVAAADALADDSEAERDEDEEDEDEDESDDELNDDFEEKGTVITNSNTNMNLNDDRYDRLITALKKIKYENMKKNQTTIGRRNLEIRTRIFCSKKLNGIKGDKLHLNRKEKVFTLPEQETYIMITKDTGREHIGLDGVNKSEMHTESSQFKTIMENESTKKYGTEKPLDSNHIDTVNHVDPEIVISGPAGSENNYVTYPSIKSGVRIFQELNFHLTSSGDSTLDSCHVTIFPALNFDHEQMTVEDSDVANENIHLKFIKDGVEIVGNESFERYSKILDAIIYSNKKPAFYLNRVFKLKCEKSDEGREIESNEYGVTLTVLHPKQTPSTPIATSPTTEATSSGGGSGHHEEKTQVKFAHAMIHPHEVQEPQNHLRNIIKGQSASHSTMLIVVICVVFVLLICGVGIARLRNNSVSAKNKGLNKKIKKCDGDDDGASGSGHCMKNRDDNQQLDWDDSSLTITINPMQDGQLMPMSDDSSESENSDSEDEESK